MPKRKPKQTPVVTVTRTAEDWSVTGHGSDDAKHKPMKDCTTIEDAVAAAIDQSAQLGNEDKPKKV